MSSVERLGLTNSSEMLLFKNPARMAGLDPLIFVLLHRFRRPLTQESKNRSKKHGGNGNIGKKFCHVFLFLINFVRSTFGDNGHPRVSPIEFDFFVVFVGEDRAGSVRRF